MAKRHQGALDSELGKNFRKMGSLFGKVMIYRVCNVCSAARN